MSKPRQLHLDITLESSKELSNFILCDSTRFLLLTIEDFLLNDSDVNFLFLWGRKGVGKSYLLRAVNKEYLKKKKNTAFISFSNPLVNSPQILKGLEKYDIIFIEDLHLMPQKKDWEIAVFNLFNLCLNERTRLFFTSLKTAKNLNISLPDLSSRLVAINSLEVPEITEEEKSTAIREASDRRGMNLDGKVLQYILNHTSRSLSDLLKLISDLDSFSLEKQRKLSIPLIKELLANDNTQGK